MPAEPNEASTKHVLEGRELIDYLVEKTAQSTNAELLGREERRNRRMAAALSVLTFVGIGAIVGAIKMFVQQEIASSERRVAEQVRTTLVEEFRQEQAKLEEETRVSVTAQVEQRVGQVSRELEHYKVYQELVAQAEVITSEVQEGKMPDRPLALALEAIETLAEVEEINGQFRFLEAVNVVVDLLVRADRNAEIDRLDDRLREVLASHRPIALDLTDHYGQVIVSSPHPAEKLRHEHEALERYARASREMEYPEKALMWELFVAYKGSGYRPNRTTRTMVEMALDLNDADTNSFCYYLMLNSDPLHWMSNPDHEGRELARLVRGLFEDHEPLRRLVNERAEDPSLAPRLAQLAQRRAERIGAQPTINQPTFEQPPAAEPPQTASDPGVSDNQLRR